MTAWGDVLFLFCAAIAIGTACGTVLARNPLRGAVSLLVHIVALAGLFMTLHAQLLAALQLLVYAGAVVVLFIFVIMLIGPDSKTPASDKGYVARAFSVALGLLSFGGVAFVLYETTRVRPPIALCPPEIGTDCDAFGGVGRVARALYLDYAVPFELVSVLLTVAIVGAIAVARGRTVLEHNRAVEAARLAREAQNHPVEANEPSPTGR